MLTKSAQKGLIYVFITALLSGISIYINKFAVTDVNPYVLTFAKNFLVAIIIMSVLLFTKEMKTLKMLTFKDWLTLVFIGIIGGSLPFLFFFKGLQITSAVQASFIHKNMFLAVGLLAPILIKEKVNKNFFIAGLILLLGNVFLVNKSFRVDFTLGNILIALATLFWTVENILSKKILYKLSGNIVGWARMFFGSLVLLSFLIINGSIEKLGFIDRSQFFWILLTGLLLLGYVLTWYKGLKYLKVSTATAVLTLGVAVTTILNIISTQQIILRDIAGIILISLGILILFKLRSFFTLIDLIARRFVFYRR